jgi:hypothetical protein
MLIWRGWGIVVAGIVIVAFVLGVLAASALHLGRNESSLLAAVSLIPAGIATWYVGKRMNRTARKELIDPATGQTVVVNNPHDFFFIKVEWWGPIITIGAILLVIILIVTPPSTTR